MSADRLGRALGTFSGVAGLAVLGGPVIGGAIAEGLSWEWIFLINVPIGLLLIPFAWRRVPESRGATVAVDVVGVALVAGAALSLVWGLVRGNTAGWGSGEVIGSLTAGALLTIAFLAWERRARQPILPTQLFCSRPFRSGNAASFMLYGALYSATFFMAQFQQSALGASPLEAGVRLLPWTVTLFLVAPRAGPAVPSRRWAGRGDGLGQMLQAIGLTWIGLIAEPGLPYAAMVAPMVIAGLGVSAAMPAVQKPCWVRRNPARSGGRPARSTRCASSAGRSACRARRRVRRRATTCRRSVQRRLRLWIASRPLLWPGRTRARRTGRSVGPLLPPRDRVPPPPLGGFFELRSARAGRAHTLISPASARRCSRSRCSSERRAWREPLRRAP